MKKNGFVLLETVITICVLSVVLLSLYSTYAYILRKSLKRNTYDLTDTIYKGYYITETINNRYPNFTDFLESSCEYLDPGYKCIISDSNNPLHFLNDVYEIDKIYFINPKNFYDNQDYLNKLDATTIDYVKEFGSTYNGDYLIIKYKIIYEDGTYEIFHSRVEV